MPRYSEASASHVNPYRSFGASQDDQRMSFVVEPLECRTLMNGTILFVRGATRSGGFLDGGSAAVRDDQLADINNASTAAGNHGWATLSATLRDAGFVLEQITEPKGPDTSNVIAGRPIRF